MKECLGVKEVHGSKFLRGIKHYLIEFDNYKRRQWIPFYDLTYETRSYWQERLSNESKKDRENRYVERCLKSGKDPTEMELELLDPQRQRSMRFNNKLAFNITIM